jgi:GWxTD domain-containing protein
MRLAAFVVRLSAAFLLLSLSVPIVSALDRQQAYARWLDEDVRWIITKQERTDFLRLSNNQERDHFVVSFWARRDPTPGTPENEFKEEHYRRLAFANEHFASSKAGWETDRGRIYVVYGPPDETEHFSSAESIKNRSTDDGATVKTSYEIWRYGHLKNAGDVIITFVDDCNCGNYHLKTDPSENNLLP